MRDTASPAWRAFGDVIAFDYWAWESKSIQFYGVAKELLAQFDKGIAEQQFETIQFLPTAEFLLALALELICKAHYLRSKAGPREKVYGHDTWTRLNDSVLDEKQKTLMSHAQQYVEWAGRYPTPKWTSDEKKAKFDADRAIADGVEAIDGTTIPNTASRPRCDELLLLYEHIYALCKALPGHNTARPKTKR